MKTETDTPQSGTVWPEILRLREIIKSLEMQLAASQQEVERLRAALQSCYWATNTYDGNYARACDNVEIIVTNALKTQDADVKRIAAERNKAEAEVERLKGLLAKAIDCLESSSNGYVRLEGYEIRESLLADGKESK
jgi:fructose 1,6-bisphosphatase